MSSLSGFSFGDRLIKVDYATPRNSRTVPEEGDSKYKGTDTQNSIYIGNLDFAVTAADIEALCNEKMGEGSAREIRVAVDRQTGTN